MVKLLWGSVAVILLLITGHFCLANTTHTGSEHSHNSGLSENYDLEKCCQGYNSVSFDNIIIKKSIDGFLNNSISITATPNYDTILPVSKQNLLSLAPPNQSLQNFIPPLLS